MERKVNLRNKYKPHFHKCVGATEMRPNMTLPIREVVKRFTLPVLKEMEAKSLLNYEYDENTKLTEDQRLSLVSLKSNLIDFTDLDRLNALAQSQIEQAKNAAAAAAEKKQDDSANVTSSATPQPVPDDTSKRSG